MEVKNIEQGNNNANLVYTFEEAGWYYDIQGLLKNIKKNISK